MDYSWLFFHCFLLKNLDEWNRNPLTSSVAQVIFSNLAITCWMLYPAWLLTAQDYAAAAAAAGTAFVIGIGGKIFVTDSINTSNKLDDLLHSHIARNV